MKIMNKNNNQSTNNSSSIDDAINHLLAKYNLNKIADSVRTRKFSANDNSCENQNGDGKEISRAPKVYKNPNFDDILKRYSSNYGNHEDTSNAPHQNNEQNYHDLSIHNKNIYHENTRNLDANYAYLKSKITNTQNKNENYRNMNQNTDYSNNSYAEKTTYCRPVCNIYNEQFIFKTLERNAKLQELLKKLILARRREKEKEEWNNYVNELKNKHEFISSVRRPNLRDVPQERVFIGHNGIYKINQTQTMGNSIDNSEHEYRCYPQKSIMVDEGSGSGHLSENDNLIHCYPMAWEGRIRMMEKARERERASVYRKRPPLREAYLPRIIYVDMAKGDTPKQVSTSDNASDTETDGVIEPVETGSKTEVTDSELEVTDSKLEVTDPVAQVTNSKSQGTNPRLQDSSIQNSRLKESRLQDSRLRDSRLQDSSLQDSSLEDFRLQDSRLQGSRLQDSSLQDSRLQDSRPQDSRLEGSRLQDSRLQDSRIQRSRKQDSRLQDSSLQDSRPQGFRPQDSRPQDSRLQDFRLEGSRLQDSRLQDSRIQGSRLQDSRLQGSRLDDTRLQDSQLQVTDTPPTLVNDRRLRSSIEHPPPPPATYAHYVPMVIRIEREKKIRRRTISTTHDKIVQDEALSTTGIEGTTAGIEGTATISTQFQGLQDNGVQVGGSKSTLENQTTKEKYDEVTKNVDRLKAEIESNDLKNQDQGQMSAIEKKIDVLCECLNELFTMVKNTYKNSSIKLEVKEIKEFKNTEDRDDNAVSGRNGEVTVGYVETNTSTSAFQAFPSKRRRFEPAATLDEIICEELDKSNRLRRELGELLHTQIQENHSVQIAFDIPTRECATEVTESLPRTVISDKEVEEMSLSVEESQMTIAVNTDPMGLLTLLTMSTDAVRHMMSYVPTVDYAWYLSRLPLPHLSVNNVSDFVCNICGASYKRPSQLNDHMTTRHFGDTKDCCVCRHALDLKRRKGSLFPCRYCGRRFTRSYCCELHQQDCARARGLHHDAEPGLALLH